MSDKKISCLQEASKFIITRLESFFYRFGYIVASRPWMFIIGSFTIVVSCCVGLRNFHRENNPDKLWVPVNSDFYNTSSWLIENFPTPIRKHYAILEAEDVLEPSVIKELLLLHERARNKHGTNGDTWDEVCFRIPVVTTGNNFNYKFDHMRRLKRDNDDNFLDNDLFDVEFESLDIKSEEISRNSADIKKSISFNTDFDDQFDHFQFEKEENHTGKDISLFIPRGLFCSGVDGIPKACWEQSILELWSYNSDVINNLTKEDIIRDINGIRNSPIFGTHADYSVLLGDISRNSNGDVISAKTVLNRWFTFVNYSAIPPASSLDAALGEPADPMGLSWELELIEAVNDFDYHEGIKAYVRAWRSFGDISSRTVESDYILLALGYMIVLAYVAIMLGEFNVIEQRPLSSLMGVLCIFMSVMACSGVLISIDWMYSPIHSVLLFVSLGLGIDNMFVIVQCWNNLSDIDTSKKELNTRIGTAVKHSGVAITVTSITDVFAFGIGGTTVLPALRSFCIYAAAIILCIFILQMTFFLAWFTVEQRRIEKNMNSLLCCHQHHHHKPNKFINHRNVLQNVFGNYYAKWLIRKPCKIFALMFGIGLLGLGIFGLKDLRQKFDPMWLIPTDSYFTHFTNLYIQDFQATAGEEAFIFFINSNYTETLPIIDKLVKTLQLQDYIEDVSSNWYSNFKTYIWNNFDIDVCRSNMTDLQFREYLTKFLFSPEGGEFQRAFKFYGNLDCRNPTPPIEVSALSFRYQLFTGAEQEVPAMVNAKKIVSDIETKSPGSWHFIWCYTFVVWETNQVIVTEITRNMILATGCVFLATLLLIANIRASVLVLLCVIITLIEILGFMHLWNLTVDTVSCIAIVISIGMCIDYSAHIAHTFMKCKGSRDSRVVQTLRYMGPAVFNGGFSTFVAMFFICDSKSHIFITFYKVFTLVVIFGLFQGIVLLPVLLSFIGSAPYFKNDQDKDERKVRIVDKECDKNGKENTVMANNTMQELRKNTEESGVDFSTYNLSYKNSLNNDSDSVTLNFNTAHSDVEEN